MSYNSACGARLDCSDRTLFSGLDEEGLCTGDGGMHSWFHHHFRMSAVFLMAVVALSVSLWLFRLAHSYSLSSMQLNDLQGAYIALDRTQKQPCISQGVLVR